MKIAIQAGDKDKDPAQSRRFIEDLLDGLDACVVYVDQPSTIQDRVVEVCEDLGLDVVKITPDFMSYGMAAVDYAMTKAVADADVHVVVCGSQDPCGADLEFMSYVDFLGYQAQKSVIPYERIEVL